MEKSVQRVPLALAFALAAASAGQAAAITPGRLDPAMLRTPLYDAEGDAFVRHNGDRLNNRPLYCNQIPAIVLAGDRPLVRFGNGAMLDGTFMVALARGGKARWLHEASDVTSRYRPGRMEWTVGDAALGQTAVTVEAVPASQGAGMAVRARVEHGLPGDQLIWAFGGAAQQKGGMQKDWDVTTAAWDAHGPRAETMARGFSPADCRGDHVTIDGGTFTVHLADRKTAVAGSCDVPTALAVADADAWAEPVRLAASAGTDRPIACGVVDVSRHPVACWAFAETPAGQPSPPADPAAAFTAGMARVEAVENRVVVETPDARLNAMVAASTAVTDAVFREGIFTHAGMRWGVPLLGWRTMFGGTAYGWHDRVMTQARLCLARQVTGSDKVSAKADPKYGLSSQAPDSRLFGDGRVDLHQPFHYDMQSQFFDQLVHEWRSTGDPALEKLLRPALERHLDYLRDCFDPDDTGLYESYANSWPTDDQWYDGGGTAEETAYAYAGHQAALEMARRAGDAAAVARHAARLAKIRSAFQTKLWVPSSQHVGGWVEQGGHQRLHEDGWLYATFCPIDAGLLDPGQAERALYYTEWDLEREPMPYGGHRCWTSNWVPSEWSLREMWPGDNYHLALAYFQTGLADDGWDLLRGTFPAMAFYGPVPGDLGYPNGGTDFNDCASLFCRTVVEGLFGYRPDYPNGVVTIAPQLPSDWDHASIHTPDVKIDVGRNRCHVELARPAPIDLRLPVRARRLTAVTVNGQPCKWELLPGFGCSVVKVAVPAGLSATVELTCEGSLPQYPAVAVETVIGGRPDLSAVDATNVTEPAVMPAGAGHQLVESVVKVGDAPQRRLFKVHVSDPAAEAAEAAASITAVPADARWDPIDLSSQFNGDVRAIFQQQYLSPRPNTCSLRLATDGYSTWQMMLDPKHRTPTVDLAGVPKLLDSATRLRTPQGVPFAWADGGRNIAFTSMWDNWPRQVTVPVGRQAEGVWLLLCGFTSPMQCRIENAVLRLAYTDGGADVVPLVPPVNFWSMCPFGPADYNYDRDGFCLPKVPPMTVQLGGNCRAILLGRRLRPGVALASVTLETRSQETTIGLMGVSLENAR
jgi:hypothetical protein